jgi:hypothetical protein
MFSFAEHDVAGSPLNRCSVGFGGVFSHQSPLKHYEPLNNLAIINVERSATNHIMQLKMIDIIDTFARRKKQTVFAILVYLDYFYSSSR